MSKKIITSLFAYATKNGAKNLVISGQANEISLDCHLPGGQTSRLILPKKLKQEFFANLRQIMTIAPGELFARKYQKINDKNGAWKYYLTVLPEGQNEKIIISLVNQPKKAWRLNQLGLKADDLKEVKKITNQRSGLIIVSSPPNSGKSTTLYSLLPLLNRSTVNIYALDQDPAASFPGLNSLAPTPTNWEKILQHDSDIILADDLDQDWALSQAFRAAASGRLVLGTLTADSPLAVLEKIAALKLPKKFQSDNLKLIINQRLVNLHRPTYKNKPHDRQLIGSFKLFKLTR